MSRNKEDGFAEAREKFSAMKPTELTEKLANIGRAEKVFITTFMTGLVCSTILFAMKVYGLTHEFERFTLITLMQLPIWSLFELVVLPIIFLANIVALIEYIAVGFVFKRKIEITRKED